VIGFIPFFLICFPAANLPSFLPIKRIDAKSERPVKKFWHRICLEFSGCQRDRAVACFIQKILIRYASRLEKTSPTGPQGSMGFSLCEPGGGSKP
jgi:hypothetical protein